ncbi:MAG: type II secretion system F family protein [Lachnospiraceae bacterium]|nr:type II secretion system F family protein [Lachnospiraceae bacterium]
MGSYKYTARDASGAKLKGSMKAVDEAELQAKLKKDEIYLEKASLVKEKKKHKKIRHDRLADISRNLGKLLGAGVPLVRALAMICEDDTLGKSEREVILSVRKKLIAGVALSDAMSEEEAFPLLFVSMFRAAESSGTLSETALAMADTYEKEYRFEKKIKGALTYPKILALLTIAVVVIIMEFVIPQFESMFKRMKELPFSTKVLFGVSSFIKKNWLFMLLGIVVLTVLFLFFKNAPAFVRIVDRIKLRMPLIGKRLKVIYTARFASTFASLYNAGVPIMNCIMVSAQTIGNKYVEAQFDGLLKEVRAGGKLSDSLEKIDGFSKKLISAVRVGEETGAMGEMLITTAGQLEYDSEVAIEGLVSLIEPCMIIIMAVIVGFIMISVIRPIYGSYRSLESLTGR